MNDEILLIDKPANMTSFGVVARIRRKLTEDAGHKVKVGHTGTLDPFATGLMILLTGKGTKSAAEFSKLDKEYVANIRLGETSTTGDPEGEITVKVKDAEIAEAEIKKTVGSFVGKIKQTPPAFSAIKINGQRAYKLARKGVDVEMPKRMVDIYDIEVLDYNWPLLTIRAHVSSGTYIRSLAQDIGEKLGVGAYVENLRRTKVGQHRIEDAKKLPEEML